MRKIASEAIHACPVSSSIKTTAEIDVGRFHSCNNLCPVLD